MGRKAVKKKSAARLFETVSARKLCPYCTGGDGENKEIYDTSEDARLRAEHIKDERGVRLKVYQCKFGNGWHLTKDNDCRETSAAGGERGILQDGGIPLRSAYYSKISWEYVEGEDSGAGDTYTIKTASPHYRKPPSGKPAIKAEAVIGGKNISVSGVVADIIKHISVEKIFNINLRSAFAARAANVFLEDEHEQITVLVKSGGGQHKSYTALVKKTLAQSLKVVKGDRVSVTVTGECINGKSVWRCLRMERAAAE
jgi:hypothetical protein